MNLNEFEMFETSETFQIHWRVASFIYICTVYTIYDLYERAVRILVIGFYFSWIYQIPLSLPSRSSTRAIAFGDASNRAG